MYLYKQTTRAIHSGATLLEILVTLVVVSLGLLGVASLQTNAIRDNHDSLMYSTAAFLADEIIERMRANPRAVRAGHYARTTIGATITAPTNCANADCTAEHMAKYDLNAWLNGRLSETLPEGDALITSANWNPTSGTDFAGNPIGTPVQITLTLRWKGRVSGNCDASGNTNQGIAYKCFVISLDI